MSVRKLYWKPAVLFVILISSVSSQQVLTERGVSSICGTSVTYWGFHADGSDVYAIIEKYTEDVWHYSVNDTVWLDSGCAIVEAIDTAENTATIRALPNVVGTRDEALVGRWGDGNVVNDKSIVSVLNVTESSAEFRIFETPRRKVFTYENDTIILDGDKLVYMNLYEESFTYVNCRSVIMDTVVDLRMEYFYLWKHFPFGESVYIRGGVTDGTVMHIHIRHDDVQVDEHLYLTGVTDSTDVIMVPGETITNPYENSRMTLEWTYSVGDYEYGQAVGLRVEDAENTNAFVFKKTGKVFEKVTRFDFVYNLLGRKLITAPRKTKFELVRKTKAGKLKIR